MPGPGPSPVQVIVVHREEPQKCARTVAALRSQEVAVHVTVVDNDSRPESLEILRAGVPDLDLVPTGFNAGFGPAANVGLRRWLVQGEGEWAVIAPHDALPAPGCLAKLIDAASSRQRAGLASAEYGPGHDYKPVVDRYLGGYVAPADPGDGWEDADFPHGTLLAVRRSALEEIGLFDERYFAYCEEADLAMRAAAAGWGVGIIWGAVVSNPGMAEGGVAHYLKLRNTLLFVREHFGAYPAFMRCVIAVVSMALGALRRGGSAERMRRRAERLAIRDYARGRFGPPPLGLA